MWSKADLSGYWYAREANGSPFQAPRWAHWALGVQRPGMGVWGVGGLASIWSAIQLPSSYQVQHN